MDFRVGVIGAGRIGLSHIDRLLSDVTGVQVVALADMNKELAEKVAQERGGVFRLEESADSLIASADVDGVVVCSWDPTHEELALKCIAAGKPVYVEKPLAATPEGCKRIAEAEMAGGKHLVQVGLHRRFDPGYAEMKRLLDSGEFGEPLLMHCQHRNPVAPPQFNMLPDPTALQIENSLIHEIDLLRWMLGEDYNTAQVVLPKKTRLSAEKHSDPQMLFLSTESGVHIDIESFINCQYGYDIQCELVCEKGTIRLEDPASATVRKNFERAGKVCQGFKDRFPAAFNKCFQVWVDSAKAGCVKGGSNAWDSYVCALVAEDACTEARLSKRIVDIEKVATPDFYKGF